MKPRVAIVDYGMGNLYSVQLACAKVGLDSEITGDARRIADADGIILPGVGAFRDAMDELTRTGAASAIVDSVAAGKSFFGICLGLQLLMTDSTEFGSHRGLGLIAGTVVRVVAADEDGGPLKVPHVGWARVEPARPEGWRGTLLEHVPPGAFGYFVHSYYVIVDDPMVAQAYTSYGSLRFCSAVHQRNIFACQFHPERSGPDGLRVYQHFASQLTGQPATAHEVRQ